MASLKQRNASRTNGARSRGPVTPEGKARVSRNAITHGIYSRTVVLNNENHTLYLESLDQHLAEWAPVTETERNLVIDIVDARWRLRRYSALETAALDFEVERMRPEIEGSFEHIDEEIRTVIGLNALIANNRTFEVLQTAIRHQHRTLDRATRQLVLLRKLRPGLDDSPNANTGPATSHSAEPATAGPCSETAPAPAAPVDSAETLVNATTPGSDTRPAFSPLAAGSAEPAITSPGTAHQAPSEIYRNKPGAEPRPVAISAWKAPNRPASRMRFAPVDAGSGQNRLDPDSRSVAAAA